MSQVSPAWATSHSPTKTDLCLFVPQWWNQQDRHVHPDWHGAEPHGQRWGFTRGLSFSGPRILPFTSPTISGFVLIGVKEIDIAAALEHIRDQRPGLVRTKVPSFCISVLSGHFWHGVSSWSSPSPFCSGPVWVCPDGRRWGGERHLKSSAAVRRSEGRWEQSCGENTRLWGCKHVHPIITVNKVAWPFNSYCSCFQHAVFRPSVPSPGWEMSLSLKYAFCLVLTLCKNTEQMLSWLRKRFHVSLF